MFSKKNSRPWLRALSNLSINISAAYFGVAFVGPNISFPKDIIDLRVLIFDIVFGIIFLLISVWCERRLEK